MLPDLFSAIEALDRSGLALTLCLVLDSCIDRSAEVARDRAARASIPVVIEQFTQSEPNAGRARHQAMLLGERASGNGGMLLTTDADTTPASDWLRAMVAGLARADIVAGKVVRSVTRPAPAQDRLERYYEALHSFRRSVDPVVWEGTTTHHQTSAANMAISVRHYRDLGGFMPLPSGEDARLADDAARAGLRVCRDAGSVVHTSDRRVGRVVHGFAAALQAIEEESEIIEVAHPCDVAWQYRGHAVARRGFDTGDLGALSAVVGLSLDHLVGVMRDSPNAEAFAMRVVPAPPGGMRRVSLVVAEAALAALSTARRAA